MSWLKTMKLTVDCPYCGTGYTFRKTELWKKWINAGRKDPVHTACKQAAKNCEMREVD